MSVELLKKNPLSKVKVLEVLNTLATFLFSIFQTFI